MRKVGMSFLIGAMAVIPHAALSQESAAPSADDYVCALTGDCGEEEVPAAEEATPATGDGPRVSATRGFSLSRPAPSERSQPKAATTTRQRQTAATTRPTQRQRPAQPGRVDLRLGFELGSATLSPADQEQVRKFAEALRRPQLADVRVRIEGHTDSLGGRSVNMTLSQRRAQAVADALIAQGIEATRLEVRGLGYDSPLPGKTAASPDNRRVEAVRVS